MTPPSTRRRINRAEVHRLDAAGLTQAAIARRLDISPASVCRILNPDTEQRDREAALRYKRRSFQGQGSCATCGAPVSKQHANDTTTRCGPCQHDDVTIWTRDAIIAAIQTFAARYGRPPTAAEFNPPHANATGHPEQAERWRRDGDYPQASAAQLRFGSWNAAIRAAGFTPRGPGDRLPR